MWIVMTFFLFVPAWLLLSPIEIKVDTRKPAAMIRWISIGNALVVYENKEWWVKLSVLFFRKNWRLVEILAYNKKPDRAIKPVKRQEHRNKKLQKLLSVLGSFKIPQWKMSIDTGDVAKNALIYPLNFLPFSRQHVYVNFMDENHLLLTATNTPLRMIYTWIK